MNAKIISMALGLASVVCFGAISISAHAKDSSEKDRATTAKLTHGLLSDTRHAYRPRSLDDALSSEIFDAYVEALDPDDVLFAPADLQALEKHRYKLDTAIKRGALEPIYEIAAARKNAGSESQGKDDIFELFLNAYVSTSGGEGFYRSPLIDVPAQPDSTAPDESIPPVHSTVVEAGGERIGVISVAHLNPAQHAVSAEVSNALASFRREGIEVLVLDLRGNEGGALREVLDLAGLLLGPVPVMQIREAGGRLSIESSRVARQWDGRLGVLVDRRTAAGAEMLAAALQDHNRAIVLGEQTFGRGTIQNAVNLDAGTERPRRHGWLSLTIAEVFRLNGHPLHGVGVTPDYEPTASPNRAARTVLSKPIAPVRGFAAIPRNVGAGSAAMPQAEDHAPAAGAVDPLVVHAAMVVHGLADIPPIAPPADSPAESQLARYARALQTHVIAQWVYPEGALALESCKTHVRQLPGGEVLDVTLDQTCPEDEGFRQSIRAAVLKSSPLPYTGFEDVFTRNVTMHFKAALEPVDSSGVAH